MPFLVLKHPSKGISNEKAKKTSFSCKAHALSTTSSQVGLCHGAAQALGAPLPQRPVVQEPSEDAGGQRRHQTGVH